MLTTFRPTKFLNYDVLRLRLDEFRVMLMGAFSLLPICKQAEYVYRRLLSDKISIFIRLNVNAVSAFAIIETNLKNECDAMKKYIYTLP